MIHYWIRRLIRFVIPLLPDDNVESTQAYIASELELPDVIIMHNYVKRYETNRFYSLLVNNRHLLAMESLPN